MIEEWRQWLYPLGILPAIVFAARYLLQWLTSERLGKSVVMPLFWQLSITANLLLLLHSLIQLQFHVSIIQACSAVISWRNLNLMQDPSRHLKFSSVIILLIGTATTIPLLFLLSSLITLTPIEWFRSPLPMKEQISGFWHMTGFLGLILFNGRFWVQWWNAERDKKSYLGIEFWWMSVLGSILCFLYFTVIGDFVNMVGPFFGLVPSIRNLILVQRAKVQD